jgi:hypothetical protein
LGQLWFQFLFKASPAPFGCFLEGLGNYVPDVDPYLIDAQPLEVGTGLPFGNFFDNPVNNGRDFQERGTRLQLTIATGGTAGFPETDNRIALRLLGQGREELLAAARRQTPQSRSKRSILES